MDKEQISGVVREAVELLDEALRGLNTDYTVCECCGARRVVSVEDHDLGQQIYGSRQKAARVYEKLTDEKLEAPHRNRRESNE